MGFSELFTFGIFVESILFFWNWSLGFAPILLYSWYMLFNLINLGLCKKLKILGLVLNPICEFCSIGLKLMKLAYWIDVIDHSKLFSNLCDDQLVNFFKKIQVVLKFFLGFLLETLCSSQFCEFELKLILIHFFSTCIMSFNLFMHHIAFVLYIFFCVNLQSALGFVVFFLSLYFAVCFWFLF